MHENDELTIHEAAVLFDIDSEELYLALEALDAHNEPDPNTLTARRGLWRRAKRNGATVETYFRRGDCEKALALLAAKQLGFTED